MNRRDELVDIAVRLEREREEARPQIARVRAELDRCWDDALSDSWRTLGFVQELTEVAASILEQNPRESLALAQFAVAIASGIPRDGYPAVTIAQIEGRAFKELGTANRYLSDYNAANRAYDAAKRCFQSNAALAHDAAAVDLAKAVVASEAGRFDEALEIVRQCEPVLAEFGDQKRLVHAAMVVAIVEHRRSNYAAAREGYEKALAAAQNNGNDLHTIAALYNNLALVCIELGDANTASVAVANARELFRELSMPTEVVRSESSLARLLMRSGEYRQAIPLLQHMRDEFLRAGMVDEAGVAALDIVDSLVALDQRDAAIRLVGIVLAEYRAAGLERALVALAYLRDLLRKDPSPGRVIHHVREYMSQVRTDPSRLFIPLPE